MRARRLNKREEARAIPSVDHIELLPSLGGGLTR